MVLVYWLARWIVSWLHDSPYGMFDLGSRWVFGPGHRYVDLGYPRLPEAVAMIVVPLAIYWGFVRLSERRRVRELGGGWGGKGGAHRRTGEAVVIQDLTPQTM